MSSVVSLYHKYTSLCMYVMHFHGPFYCKISSSDINFNDWFHGIFVRSSGVRGFGMTI